MSKSRILLCICFLASIFAPASIHAQNAAEKSLYARTNSFGIFTAYANDSSHILLGDAEQRKLLEIGASYSRRLILNRKLNWQYDAEILPVALESDPVEKVTITESIYRAPGNISETFQGVPEQACEPSTVTINDLPVFYYSAVTTCSRRWTMGGGISPLGFRWNFLPRHTLQPLLVAHGGFIESVNAIPVTQAGSFNFTFDLGAGIEWYRTRTQSLRVEYRYHHISNKNTAPANPGIDNGLFQVSYVFGR